MPRDPFRTLMFALGWATLAFLVLPLLIIIPMSVNASARFVFPPRSLSLRWYAAYFTDPSWLSATWMSIRVAVATAVASTALGTLGAIGLVRGRFPGKEMLHVFTLSPMIVPSIITAIALYQVFGVWRVGPGFWRFVLAHSVIAVPFVLLNVAAVLQSIDPSVEEAASGLGASPLRRLIHVTIPLLLPGVMSGAAFAFIISFDEIVISMFLSGVSTATLSKRMLDGLFFELNPTIAAVATLLICLNVAVIAFSIAVSNRQRRSLERPPGM